MLIQPFVVYLEATVSVVVQSTINNYAVIIFGIIITNLGILVCHACCAIKFSNLILSVSTIVTIVIIINEYTKQNI